MERFVDQTHSLVWPQVSAGMDSGFPAWTLWHDSRQSAFSDGLIYQQGIKY